MASFRKTNQTKRQDLQQLSTELAEMNLRRAQEIEAISAKLSMSQQLKKLPTTQSNIIGRHLERKKQRVDNDIEEEFLTPKRKQEFGSLQYTAPSAGAGDVAASKSRTQRMAMGAASVAGIHYTPCMAISTKRRMPVKPAEKTQVIVKDTLDSVLDQELMSTMVSYIAPVALPRQLDLTSKPKSLAQLKKGQSGMQKLGITAQRARQTADAKESNLTPSVCLGPTLEEFAASLNTLEELRQTQDLADTVQDPEITIVVCDEVRRATCEFSCPQNMLIEHMGYFADISSQYDMEDIDITVNCDIVIFQWLINWIKYETLAKTKKQVAMELTKPSLNTENISAVLMAAWSLKMHPLFDLCLAYCRENLCELVRCPYSFQHLDDAMFGRLAQTLTNEELEAASVDPENITEKLWPHFIKRLSEPTPDNTVGHYYSLSFLMRCSRCRKCLPSYIESSVSCTRGNLYLNRWGQFMYTHVLDTSWRLDSLIQQLYKELSSWRLVYWKLWCKCHVLYCKKCEMHFSVDDLLQCRAHSGSLVARKVDENDTTKEREYHYSCCGQQGFRFETFRLMSGCCAHVHRVEVVSDCDKKVLSIVEKIATHKKLFNSNKMKNDERQNEPKYTAITLLPERERPGILPTIAAEKDYAVWREYVDPADAVESTTELDNKSIEKKHSWQRLELDSSTDDDELDFMMWQPKPVPVQKKQYDLAEPTRVKVSGRYWDNSQPLHFNQDQQRDFEEKIMKHITESVRKKLGFKQNEQPPPIGGIYMRLEAEWQEAYRKRQQLEDGQIQAPVRHSKYQKSKYSQISKGTQLKENTNC